ncbi:HMG box domain-containing protein [[Candida] zeylanoides]
MLRLTTALRGIALVRPAPAFAAARLSHQPSKPAASAPRKKKPLTEEQKAEARAKKDKAAAKEKKLKQQALKKPFKLSGFNVYVSQNYDTSMAITTQKYSLLSEGEKQHYQTLADEQYVAVLAEFEKGKPAKPLSSFANFTKQNYNASAGSFADAIKELAAKWKQLTTQEKDAYKSNINLDEYHKQSEAWKAKRIEEFSKAKEAENAKRRVKSKKV